PVVRFTHDEGMVRGDGMCVDGSIPLTVMYVARIWGSTVWPIFSNNYPPHSYNFLVGAHIAGEPRMYDNGWGDAGAGWAAIPSPWKIYGAVCTDTPAVLSTLYADGAVIGSTATSIGHDSEWNISGYTTTSSETCDCEVAELICYNRALTPTERVQVEQYLQAKWFAPPSV